MNEHPRPQPISNSPSRFRCFLPHLIAFVVTLLVMTCFTYFVQSRSIFPPDALIIQTHGYNDKALEALRSAGIPMLTMIDTSAIHRASAFSSLMWSSRSLVFAFVVYFVIFALSRRLSNETDTSS